MKPNENFNLKEGIVRMPKQLMQLLCVLLLLDIASIKSHRLKKILVTSYQYVSDKCLLY